MELIPSIQRVTVRITGLMVVGCLAAYLWQGYFQNRWWSLTDVISLLVPLAVMLAAKNFRGSPSIQIFSHAYPPEQWSQLTEFLLRQFPDRKADGFLGPFGFRIGR